MAYRCPHYLCEAISTEGLIQQVALSYLRHGYWWYVTGMVPERKDPAIVDLNILTKYNIRKDWRFTAENKMRGVANLQYIRHHRFYLIMATKGWHEFKDREGTRLRDARSCPILIPREFIHETASGLRKAQGKKHVFDGYAVSFRRGGYVRKSPEEKAAYRQAIEHWRKQTALGNKLPRPPKGNRDPKWHSCVEIERHSLRRLRAYFLEIATHRTRESLEYEFSHTGFVPYQPVKRQLTRIVKEVNEARRVAGSSEQIPYRTVLWLRREQISPFASVETRTSMTTAA